MKRPKKAAAPPPKRGKCMTLPQIEVIEAAHEKAKEDNPHLSAIGFTRLALPPTIKQTAGKKVLKQGKAPAEIDSRLKESRAWGDAKRTVDRANIKKVKKMIQKDNSAANVSNRLLASKLGCSRESARKITKSCKVRPLKHVKQPHNCAAKMAKRKKIAAELLDMYKEGMRTKRVFWSDETWVDENTCARYNPQNDRKYYCKSVSKLSVLEELKKPLKVRTPGVMAHITVSSATGAFCSSRILRRQGRR